MQRVMTLEGRNIEVRREWPLIGNGSINTFQ
jgi:hypothetical protein